MSDMHLIGSEQVGRAGYNIQEAAASLQSAANTMSEAAHKIQTSFDNFLFHFERLVARIEYAQCETKENAGTTPIKTDVAK